MISPRPAHKRPQSRVHVPGRMVTMDEVNGDDIPRCRVYTGKYYQQPNKKKKYVCGRVVTGGREFEYKADRGTEIASRARQRARNTRALVILNIRVGGGVHGVS